jgi:hypothetical protein
VIIPKWRPISRTEALAANRRPAIFILAWAVPWLQAWRCDPTGGLSPGTCPYCRRFAPLEMISNFRSMWREIDRDPAYRMGVSEAKSSKLASSLFAEIQVPAEAFKADT